ncbi:MAG: ATP synthase F0 subunit B [Oscillospiraceae bacterium]|nr:ATP synthase F0 subunit B [Oscillospiraceae bacterium]
MTVQPSITIWTIICFLALFFILKKLLFIPMLELMDKREAKIKEAEEAKKNALEAIERQKAERKAALAEEKLRLHEETEARADAIRMEGKELLEKTKAEGLAALESFQNEIGREYVRDLGTMRSSVKEISVRFLDSLYARES